MRKLTKEEFIEKSNKVHHGKYDYSKVEYVNTRTKVCIICPIHGEFWQTPHAHLEGKVCPMCSSTRAFTTEEFKKKANKVHNFKYDYSKVNYTNNKTKVPIICPIHGEFWQTPHNHLKGQGCPMCGVTKQSDARKTTLEEFKKKANKVHNFKYDYSKVNYTNNATKVPIICPIHGEFLQAPRNHLVGKGCPMCGESKLEKEIRLFLLSKNINAEQQKMFDWLGKQRLDFYLSQYNVAIECQGIQHFQQVEYFGGDLNLEYVKECDSRKKILCEEHGIKLLYYSNLDIEYPYNVITDKEKILEELEIKLV